jgi:hypothetical protein
MTFLGGILYGILSERRTPTTTLVLIALGKNSVLCNIYRLAVAFMVVVGIHASQQDLRQIVEQLDSLIQRRLAFSKAQHALVGLHFSIPCLLCSPYFILVPTTALRPDSSASPLPPIEDSGNSFTFTTPSTVEVHFRTSTVKVPDTIN